MEGTIVKAVRTALVALAISSSLILGGCGGGDEAGVDLLAGAVDYTGDYPEPAIVSYVLQDVACHSLAFPGQVEMVVSENVSAADASTLITANSGAVLASIPMVGYYLVGVNPGVEGDFISAIGQDARVMSALPHVPYSPCGSFNVGDAGTHGQDVEAAYHEAHPSGSLTTKPVVVLPNGYYSARSARYRIVESWGDSRGADSVLNLSFGPDAGGRNYSTATAKNQAAMRAGYKASLTTMLNVVRFCRIRGGDRMLVTIAAGNSRIPLNPILSDIRQDPRLNEILNNNVRLVTVDPAVYPSSNYGSDPAIWKVGNTWAAKGSSCGSPYATGLAQQLLESGLSKDRVRDIMDQVQQLNGILTAATVLPGSNKGASGYYSGTITFTVTGGASGPGGSVSVPTTRQTAPIVFLVNDEGRIVAGLPPWVEQNGTSFSGTQTKSVPNGSVSGTFQGSIGDDVITGSYDVHGQASAGGVHAWSDVAGPFSASRVGDYEDHAQSDVPSLNLPQLPF